MWLPVFEARAGVPASPALAEVPWARIPASSPAGWALKQFALSVRVRARRAVAAFYIEFALREPTPSGQQTRHVKASARRGVWPRDQGRCGFVGEDGHRCNETRGLHFAHRKPWAKGGANTAENLGLRCPAHNALEADRDYGTRFMANKRKQKPLKVRESLARYILSREPRATLVDAERSQHSSDGSGGANSLERPQSGSNRYGRRGADGLGDLTPETVGHHANATATPVGVQGELRC